MNKAEFEILNLIRKQGKTPYRLISTSTGISLGSVSETIKRLKANGEIDESSITEKGLDELAPYKVSNAVILAAGPSSRFVPLSLELPKALFKVKGEVLIERQIEQLQEAGIKDITVVLGYKKELLFYLKEKYGVNLLINAEYNRKNNIESLYLARKQISSTYICSCDDYFASNPFDLYEYRPFYASIYCPIKKKESYAKINAKGQIVSLRNAQNQGDILLGHSYWDKSFSKAFVNLIQEAHETGEYDGNFWEKLLADFLKKLPPIYLKKYQDGEIFEFDSLSELREFDDKYVNNAESRIMANICLALKCEQKDIVGFRPIHEGMTNTSFVFEAKGKRYVYREPGDGTEKIINRAHEKTVLELAKKLGFDPTYVYMNADEGWKISSFVSAYREPSYDSEEDAERVAKTLRKLHSSPSESISWVFEPVEEADRLEKLTRAKGTIAMHDFESLKADIHSLSDLVSSDGVEKCWCHGDTYRSNWMLKEKETILIDWEYSSLADPGVDVGYYIVDAMYEKDAAENFIKMYCGETYNETLRCHYLSYVAIIAYYWFVWALYRESCGAVIGESLFNWYSMAKKYSALLLSERKEAQKNKKLSRMEFELLKLLAEKGEQALDYRYLSNTLLCSDSLIRKTVKSSLDAKWISKKGKRISLGEAGTKELDNYKVDRAIIMAAGFGSRMAPVTLERPKPLVKVNGTRIIDTLLDALIAKGINEIYLIRGYKKECFDELLEKYPFIHFVDNDDYNVTNNISSIIKALDHVDDCYICEADFVVSNKDIISKYHYQSDYLGAAVKETDDWCFRNVDGYAVDYKKGGENCCQAYGISYWNREDSRKLRAYLPQIFASEEGKQQFWESCVFDFYKDKFNIEIKECSKFDIVEIDCFEELIEIDPSYQGFKLR